MFRKQTNELSFNKKKTSDSFGRDYLMQIWKRKHHLFDCGKEISIPVIKMLLKAKLDKIQLFLICLIQYVSLKYGINMWTLCIARN